MRQLRKARCSWKGSRFGKGSAGPATYRLAVIRFATIAGLWSYLFFGADGFPAHAVTERLREHLRARIEAAGAPPKIMVGREPIYASATLPRFYERRAYRPAWVGDKGPLPQIEALVQAIQEADRAGLRPGDYHLARIEAMLAQLPQKTPAHLGTLVDLELLLSDAFLIYASHLWDGRVNPVTFDPEWHADRPHIDLAALLAMALESGRVGDALSGLLPLHPDHTALRESLARYREIAAKGGWHVVPGGLNLQRGDREKRVELVRARLHATGDLIQEPENDAELFDETLEAAVRRFQERHGLDVDGIIGRATLAALNVPVEERLEQIKLNMERWRWLPQNLGQRYILVNIAGFELEVVENTRRVMTMRVVVGKDYRRTPVFTGKMTYLVLSPYWNITPNMAVRDKLPLLRQDPDFQVRENIRVFQGWGAETKEIDPKTIDWSKVSPRNFRYRLRQEPGPGNALGRVKFMFPNRFDVYLHDTPSRELFTKPVRTFSSGCIRIEKPIELAEHLLRGDPRWTRQSILSAIDRWKEQTVRLPETVPVHILYWTAWVSEDRSVQFRNDIYGRDRKLADALRQAPPAS